MADKRLPLPQRPDGMAGRVFGFVMEWMNAGAYRVALRSVEARPEDRMLEIGFGTGRFLELASRAAPGLSVAGVDPSETMSQLTRRRLSRFPGFDPSQIVVGFERPLPWPDETFTVVVAIHCFQFWQDPTAAVAELRRVLRKSGRIVIVLRAHPRPPEWLPNPLSRSGNEVDSVRRLLEATGFTTMEPSASGSSRVVVARGAA